MITKDWAQEAANEIAENVRCGDGNEEDYREIIVKHCPFKPWPPHQLSARPDVSYMPVPRCDQCKFWQPNDSRILPEASGICVIADDLNTRKRHSGELGYLHTTADFGCVQWETK